MNRRELREQIFMLLFRVEFNQKDDMPEQCTLFLEDGDTEISEKDAAEYLANHTYFFKIAAYRILFEKRIGGQYDGQYVNLDFGT